MAAADPAPAAVAGASIKAGIRARAEAIGFHAIGFTTATLPPSAQTRLHAFLAQNHHGDMTWLAERTAQRAHPNALWPAARSIIALGLAYTPDSDPLATLRKPSAGNISVYARDRDYHDVTKGMLKHLAQYIAATHTAEVKVFVDTAPVLEKPLAQQAGVGWQGKHTNLVSRAHGSWLFLGEIYTTLDLPPDQPHPDRCGTCTACLTACPTDAFPAPYRLDATRCISYLTIEHKGPIPLEFRRAIGNRIYGCDDCLAACPWNRFAQSAHEKLQAQPRNVAPDLATLATLTDATFRTRFTGSPIKRLGRDRFIRNVLIAIGNSADLSLLPTARHLAQDPDPIVAEAAAWATSQLDRLETT